jgi:ER membrane protein complex subunit 1
MWRVLGIWLASLAVLPALAIHASEAGVVDWYKPFIGDALTGNPDISPVFHRFSELDGRTRSLVLTATTSNVLAALHPENGTIGTSSRRGLRDGDLMTDYKFSVAIFVR